MPAVILNNLRYTKNAVKTIYIYRNQYIFISSQLNYSVIYGHRQLTHKKQNRFLCLGLKI